MSNNTINSLAGYHFLTFNFVFLFYQMIFRILEMPLVDILLIFLLIRLLFPRIFISGKRNKAREKTSIFVRTNRKKNSSQEKNNKGEYIEYEEIK